LPCVEQDLQILKTKYLEELNVESIGVLESVQGDKNNLNYQGILTEV